MEKYLTFLLLSIILIKFSNAQSFFGFNLSDINPFAGPSLDKEFQTRRYSCNAQVSFGLVKSCVCIIKIVKKKNGNFLQSLGCEGNDEGAQKLMVNIGKSNSLVY